jgi:hypothetical protein
MLGPRQMMREKSEFNELVKAELMAAVPNISGAYPGLLKLAFLDAAYYDVTDYPNATGGANGSIATSDELARPENATAKAMVEVSVFDAGDMWRSSVKTLHGPTSALFESTEMQRTAGFRAPVWFRACLSKFPQLFVVQCSLYFRC